MRPALDTRDHRGSDAASSEFTEPSDPGSPLGSDPPDSRCQALSVVNEASTEISYSDRRRYSDPHLKVDFAEKLNFWKRITSSTEESKLDKTAKLLMSPPSSPSLPHSGTAAKAIEKFDPKHYETVSARGKRGSRSIKRDDEGKDVESLFAKPKPKPIIVEPDLSKEKDKDELEKKEHELPPAGAWGKLKNLFSPKVEDKVKKAYEASQKEKRKAVNRRKLSSSVDFTAEFKDSRLMISSALAHEAESRSRSREKDKSETAATSAAVSGTATPKFYDDEKDKAPKELVSAERLKDVLKRISGDDDIKSGMTSSSPPRRSHIKSSSAVLDASGLDLTEEIENLREASTSRAGEEKSTERSSSGTRSSKSSEPARKRRSTFREFSKSSASKSVRITKKEEDLELRGAVLAELIQTEENYVSDLKLLVEKFVHPLKKDPDHGITQEEATVMFSNVEIIASFHQKLLRELQSSLEPGEVFSKYADFLKMYTQYTSGYERSIGIFHAVRGNSKFKHFLDRMRKDDELSGKEISGLLILPVQRIPRYLLLLKQLAKHTSETDARLPVLLDAISKIEKVASHINEHQRTFDSLTRLLEIQHNSGSHIPEELQIIKPGRQLNRERLIRVITDRRFSGVIFKHRILLLFNDCLMVTRPNHELKHFLYLAAVNVSAIAFQDLPVFLVATSKEKLRFACKSVEERDEWISFIEKTKSEVKKEREQKWTRKKEKVVASSAFGDSQKFDTLSRLKRWRNEKSKLLDVFDKPSDGEAKDAGGAAETAPELSVSRGDVAGLDVSLSRGSRPPSPSRSASRSLTSPKPDSAEPTRKKEFP